MTILELKSSFTHAYRQPATAIYSLPANINAPAEDIDTDTHLDITSHLAHGIYLLLSKNNDGNIKYWSLNEPELIKVNISELTVPLQDTWIRHSVNVFGHYIKQGIEIQSGYDILIWGNLPATAGITAANALQQITATALNDQLSNSISIF